MVKRGASVPVFVPIRLPLPQSASALWSALARGRPLTIAGIEGGIGKIFMCSFDAGRRDA